MARKTFTYGDTGEFVKGVLDDNFSELYGWIENKIIVQGHKLTYALLSSEVDATTHAGEYWIVDSSTGYILLFNVKSAGLYVSDGATWQYVGIDVNYVLEDDAFYLLDGADHTKSMNFELGNITTGTIRTLTIPDKSGTLAFTSDLTSYVLKAGDTMTGPLLFTDNTFDIGASGATRPRIGYFGTSIVAPTGRFTNLTDGYLPYHISDASGLANSGFYWDAINGRGGIGTTSPVSIQHINSDTPYLTFSPNTTDILPNQTIGLINFYSKDISDNSLGGVGNIAVKATTRYNTGYTPSYMTFSTHSDSVNNGTVLGNPTERMRIDMDGRVGVGTTFPTAVLHLKAGTATASTAPLKFTSGVLNTTAEAGAVEFLTDKFYATQTTGATRKEIKLVDQYYAEMYVYENAIATVIGTQNVYHAIAGSGLVTGLLSGFTFVQGLNGTIASVADYNGTVAGTVLITDVAHGLTTGDIVTIHSTTDYNGTFSITKVTNDTFYITETYTSSQTGDWSMGAYLRCSTGSDGIYKISMSNTALSAVSNETFKFELNKNTTMLDNTAASRKFGTNGDYGSLGSTGLVSLVAGDRIWLSVRNETSGANITVRHCNINITRA